MNQMISDFINCHKIAVVGCSATSKKFGNAACKELIKRGHEVVVIHPTAKAIDGRACFPNLSSVGEKIDGIFISVQPQKVVPILEEAAALGSKPVWLQQGSNSGEAQAAIARLGLSAVTDKCILMYAPPVDSIHRIHRGINKLFGKL